MEEGAYDQVTFRWNQKWPSNGPEMEEYEYDATLMEEEGEEYWPEQGSKFRTIKNDGFGASKTKKLKIGDQWVGFLGIWLNTRVFFYQKGLLVDITKMKGCLVGLYGKIIPFGEEREIQIPLISVRKMQETD